jgi:hypothetical protein
MALEVFLGRRARLGQGAVRQCRKHHGIEARMHGATDVNERLIQAAKVGDLSALTQALEGGAHAKGSDSSALQWAAELGHAQCVKLLIPVSDPLANESRALRMAAGRGHEDCVKLLIEASVSVAQRSEALRWAAFAGQASCVALLLPASEKLTESAAMARSRDHMDVAGMIEAFMESQELSNVTQHSKSNPRFKSTL